MVLKHVTIWMLSLLVICQASFQTADNQELEDILNDEVELEKKDLSGKLDAKVSVRDLEDLAKVLGELLRTARHEPDYSSEEAARLWLEELNGELMEYYRKEGLAEWEYKTNITEYNEQKSTEASIEVDQWMKPQVDTAMKFWANKAKFSDPVVVRLLMKMVYEHQTPSSSDPNVVTMISTLLTSMSSIYSTAKVPAKDGGKPLDLDPDLAKIMSESRDYDELLWAWKGWRDAVGPKLKPKYTKLVEYMNKAAKEQGMHDIGVAWRYTDFEDDKIGVIVEKLWKRVKPLYEELHAYVRRKLMEKYPGRGITGTGPIPAHLLGNMWAQQWTDIFDVVVPYPNAPTYDFTDQLKAKYDAHGLFKLAEGFFVSLGLEPMTQTFWNKSMIVKPTDRKVVCHGSAESLMAPGDYRIKMCTSVNADDFETIHHEMGHVEYYMQYRDQPVLFQGSANAAFHEAVGDTISLSAMTPTHLKKLGLISDAGTENTDRISDSDINYLMKQALKKVAFLPFGYLIDLWRWDVFSGKVSPDQYNKHWWNLRLKYQGVVPPVERTEDDFDPGAKYHIPSNTPYLRYFLSFIGQFQFQQAMCKAKKHKGPLFKCDVYQSTEAGDLLKSMLKLGSSKPWPDAMEVMTGQRDARADALLEYFQPLYQWLKKENKKNKDRVGWGR